MSHRPMTRLVREGDYVAEVSVDLIEAEGGWGPYLTLDDAYRLDDIRGRTTTRRHAHSLATCACVSVDAGREPTGRVVMCAARPAGRARTSAARLTPPLRP